MMQHYRNIKLLNSVDMGNIRVVQSIDKLVDRLEQTGYTLVGAYKSATDRVKARCKQGHSIMITPNNFVNHDTGCKTCFLMKLHGHEKTIKEFEKVVKRHKLTHEPLDYSKGVLHALKQDMPFYCPRGHEYWSSPIKLVNNVLYFCHQCYVMNNKVDKA